MPWVTRVLRGERVWARARTSGELVAGADGRVEIRYRDGGKSYRAAARNLEKDPAEQIIESASVELERAASEPVVTSAASQPVIIYTDGACTGNPGPMGIGIVILDGKERREVSEFLGEGTNNIAELTAIVRALELAPRDRLVILHSDSSYALGLLSKGWKAKANQELVERMRELASEFPRLEVVKVAGHAGVPENERADELAGDAILRGS